MRYLEVSGVSKRMGADLVLDDVSFGVDAGEVVGLQGINGSGKTMSMRVVCGLVRPDRGTVSVGGLVLGRDAEFPPSVGVLIEGPALMGTYSALQNLRMVASVRGVASEGDLRDALARMGLDPDDGRPCRKYSLGMRERAGIAMAVMEAPDLVVLDEPTNALDEDGVALLARVVERERGRGAAVLLSSHDPDFLSAVADRTYRMAGGRMRGGES